MQCQKYCQERNIIQKTASDTAGAAKYIAEQEDISKASISSDLCAEIYGLQKIDAGIQDQDGNTTRFFVVVTQKVYEKHPWNLQKVGKISIQFRTKDTPSALYKCLGAFATRHINMVKIESLPAKENRFEYIFWIDLEGKFSAGIFIFWERTKSFCSRFFGVITIKFINISDA